MRAEPGRGGSRSRAATRRLPGLHHVGRLARLRRRQDPAPLPRGAGRRLDAVQDEGRRRRRGRPPADGDHPRGDRAGPDARGRRQPALGRRRRRSTGWPAWRRSTRTGSRSRRARTTSSATRRSPGPSRRSGSRPASTSTTGSCSSSSSGRRARHLPDRRVPSRRGQRGRRGPAPGGEVRRARLPARRRRRPVRARPAPRPPSTTSRSAGRSTAG